MKRIISSLLPLIFAGCTPQHKEIVLLEGEFEKIVVTTVVELRQLAERHGKNNPEFLRNFQLDSLQMLQFYKAEALDDGAFLESPE